MQNGWQLDQYDVKNAFVHANIDKDIYIELPMGFNDHYNNKYNINKINTDNTVNKRLKLNNDSYNNKNNHIKINNNNNTNNNNNKVCKLLKALYGLKQSPRLWYKHLLNILKELGFTTLPFDEAIFIHLEYKIIIICHVDDLIITGPNKSIINNIINKLSLKLKIEYIGQVHQFLGMEINLNYKDKSIYINQNKYLKTILKRFNKDKLNPISTPIELGLQLNKNNEQANKEDITKYQQQVGSLIYLAIKTRPDIVYAVNRCARFMSNPNISHFKALDRIWKYLNNYPTLGTYYNCNNNNSLELRGYTDADWGGDIISRKSTSGYIFLLNNNIISWLSILQKTVALSSCEAEYMAFKEAIKELIYLNNLVTYFSNFLNMPINNKIPLLLTDSESALKLANNPEFHKRSKHIDITYHFIREAILDKKTDLIYINTKNQLVDGFIKGLDITKHKAFISTLNLR